jgi:hypothetical protein
MKTEKFLRTLDTKHTGFDTKHTGFDTKYTYFQTQLFPYGIQFIEIFSYQIPNK